MLLGSHAECFCALVKPDTAFKLTNRYFNVADVALEPFIFLVYWKVSKTFSSSEGLTNTDLIFENSVIILHPYTGFHIQVNA